MAASVPGSHGTRRYPVGSNLRFQKPVDRRSESTFWGASFRTPLRFLAQPVAPMDKTPDAFDYAFHPIHLQILSSPPRPTPLPLPVATNILTSIESLHSRFVVEPDTTTHSASYATKMLQSHCVGWLVGVLGGLECCEEDEAGSDAAGSKAEEREDLVARVSRLVAALSGRSASGARTRTWVLPNAGIIELHEPEFATQTAEDGYGFTTWRSSLILARHIDRTPLPLPPLTVLELGSGTGLAGIAALKRGASVTLTDHNTTVLTNLRRNVIANGFDPSEEGEMSVSGRPPSRASVRRLDWMWHAEGCARLDDLFDGDDDDDKVADVPHSDAFDLVLAADCVFDPDHPSLIPRVVTARLRREPGAEFWCVVPVRDRWARDIGDFESAMEACGLALARREDVVEEGEGDRGEGVETLYRLYTYRWALLPRT
ncbi:hypothetical protein BDK51DRAFT_43591 [Blyttiomyces helicus]|uniref:Methyltransferase-domain-containing protein n=1 Tax=Blyttiomyces helicus TaxID=388810 RepID=A0A4P9W4V1_9FUNG|nr:hypothetical protein BDK51DRAFT_43591 [Blyttiomyces helicus]|eukprot:RKO85908.1 hypothetical protein BDK51DRAFT_43591 [Blyttiomyces helicus]